jgi:chitinase
MIHRTALLALLGVISSFACASSAKPVAATWYAGWHSTEFPLDKLSWSKYTHVTYSFAWVDFRLTSILYLTTEYLRLTTPDVNTLSLNASDETLIPEFVKTAKKNASESPTLQATHTLLISTVSHRM